MDCMVHGQGCLFSLPKNDTTFENWTIALRLFTDLVIIAVIGNTVPTESNEELCVTLAVKSNNNTVSCYQLILFSQYRIISVSWLESIYPGIFSQSETRKKCLGLWIHWWQSWRSMPSMGNSGHCYFVDK